MTETVEQVPDPEKPQAVAAEAGADLASIARRRALLKGLGKGAAIAGAAAPLSSLATTGVKMKLVKGGTNYLCTVSGQMSVLTSGGTTAVQCVGHPVSFYKAGANWPLRKNGKSACSFGEKGFVRTRDDTFYDCFGSGSHTSIGDLIDNQPTSDEAQWVCAVLNASVKPMTYPYLSQEVMEQYRNPTLRPSAISFHRVVAGG